MSKASAQVGAYEMMLGGSHLPRMPSVLQAASTVEQAKASHCSQTGRPLFGAKPHTICVWVLGGQGETTPYRQSQ